jgi:hypothetical protein
VHFVGFYCKIILQCTVRFASSFFYFFFSSSVSFSRIFLTRFCFKGTCQNSLLFLCCILLRFLANTCGRRHIIRGEMRTSEVESRVTMLPLPCMQQRQRYIKVQQQWLRLTVLTTHAYSYTYHSPSLFMSETNKMNKTLLPARLHIMMHVKHTIPYLYIQPSS